jgi:hypothetical protein
VRLVLVPMVPVKALLNDLVVLRHPFRRTTSTQMVTVSKDVGRLRNPALPVLLLMEAEEVADEAAVAVRAARSVSTSGLS